MSKKAFERIDDKVAYGGLLNSFECCLLFVRQAAPDLCHGLTKTDAIENVSELMRITCYKPKRQFIVAARNASGGGTIRTGAKDFAKGITAEGLEDFNHWVLARGWESSDVAATEKLTMVDENGKQVAGEVVIHTSDPDGFGDPQVDKTTAELLPVKVEPALPEWLVRDLEDQLTAADRPVAVEGVGTW